MDEAEDYVRALEGLTVEQEERVQREVERLARCAGDYADLHESVVAKRQAWWAEHHGELQITGTLPRKAFTVALLINMQLDPAEVPVVYEDEGRIVWRSTNFCPTLEACRQLGLDTRIVCRAATERSAEALIRLLDGRLRFGRNYETGIRPYAAYCEEEIWMVE